MKHIVEQHDAENYRGKATKALCGHPDARTTLGPGKMCPSCVRKAGWSREKTDRIERYGAPRAR